MKYGTIWEALRSHRSRTIFSTTIRRPTTSGDLGMYNDVPNSQANDPVYEVDAVFMDTHYKMP